MLRSTEKQRQLWVVVHFDLIQSRRFLRSEGSGRAARRVAFFAPHESRCLARFFTKLHHDPTAVREVQGRSDFRNLLSLHFHNRFI
jgi:hypothetical protein